MSARSVAAHGALALAVALLVVPPAARADTMGRARSPRVASPVERALSGGLVTLRSPGSPMIRVAAGSFVMGSSPAELALAIGSCSREAFGDRCNERSFTSELPRHTATLASFWLDRSEVTAADYDRCAATGACAPRVLEGGARRFARAELPATLVSAGEAAAYCRSRGARLPSEAELERAARGTSGRYYPWGMNYDPRLLNHGRLGLDASDFSDGFAELAPVGSFPEGRTPDGFLDLAGNASEWTRDPFTPRHDLPADPAWGGALVVRGGDFMSGGAFLRSAVRTPLAPDRRLPTVGFRCARSADSTSEP
jgi:formylglycine-generating enzyme required for sulfatase activity